MISLNLGCNPPSGDSPIEIPKTMTQKERSRISRDRIWSPPNDSAPASLFGWDCTIPATVLLPECRIRRRPPVSPETTAESPAKSPGSTAVVAGSPDPD